MISNGGTCVRERRCITAPICNTVKIPVQAHSKPTIEVEKNAIFASARALLGNRSRDRVTDF